MNSPYGNQAQGRRGMGFGGIRWWVLLLFAGYAAYYWFSNRVDDPLTGEKVLIDQSITPDDEKALGLQAWNELHADRAGRAEERSERGGGPRDRAALDREDSRSLRCARRRTRHAGAAHREARSTGT